MYSRKQYIDKMAEKLKEWDNKILQLEKDAKVKKTGISIETKQKLETLRKKRDEGRKKLAHLRESSSDAWEDMKSGFEKSWTDIKTGMQEAFKQFKA